MGIEAVQRGSLRTFLKHRNFTKVVGDKVQLSVEFRDAAGGASGGRPHLGDQEAAVLGGKKSSVMVDSTALDGKQEPRIPGFADVEEENSVLPLQTGSAVRRIPGCFLVEFRWQWCGSLPMLPGGGSGTILITLP